MILTRDLIDAHPAGRPLEVPAGTLVTSLARDAAEARGIAIVEGGAPPARGVAEARGIATVDGGAPSARGAATTCACGGSAGSTCSCEAPAPPSRPSAPRPTTGGTGDWSGTLSGRRRVDPSVWRSSGRPAPSGPTPSGANVEPNDVRRVLGPPETHVDGCTMGTGDCREDIVVVTAVGRNRPHVLAELATGIAEIEGDIQEISQRIVDGLFHTILTVDMSRAHGAFPEAKAALEALSREDDYTVRVQHERVFRYMHRI